MLKNAYFLAKIGADTAENEQHFAEILPIAWCRVPVRLTDLGAADAGAALGEAGLAAADAGLQVTEDPSQNFQTLSHAGRRCFHVFSLPRTS